MAVALTSYQAQVLVDANDGLFPHDTDEWAASQGDIQMLMGLGLVEMTDEGDLIPSGDGPAVVARILAQDFDVVPNGGQILHVFNV